MLKRQRLRIAIQKTGRLHHDSVDLLARCGITFHIGRDSLVARSENLPIDILLLRDDDIPTTVSNGICDWGIVGENIVAEERLKKHGYGEELDLNRVMKLGFGRCRLSIAFPEDKFYKDMVSLDNLRIATSYPNLLKNYLQENNIKAKIISISGSVEIAPKLDMADIICDLVATGKTLEENNLKEVSTIFTSEAILIQSATELTLDKASVATTMMRRMNGVIQARNSKYILFHVQKSVLDDVKLMLPGCETPTVLPLEGSEDRVAVHVVSSEGIFWDTLEKLKQIGASSILVLPIEKMLY